MSDREDKTFMQKIMGKPKNIEFGWESDEDIRQIKKKTERYYFLGSW
jgi:hypothetical protein